MKPECRNMKDNLQRGFRFFVIRGFDIDSSFLILISSFKPFPDTLPAPRRPSV